MAHRDRPLHPLQKKDGGRYELGAGREAWSRCSPIASLSFAGLFPKLGEDRDCMRGTTMLKTGVMLTLCIKSALSASSSANDDSRWKGSSPRDASRQSDSD
jgi:hypothetical protein